MSDGGEYLRYKFVRDALSDAMRRELKLSTAPRGGAGDLSHTSQSAEQRNFVV